MPKSKPASSSQHATAGLPWWLADGTDEYLNILADDISTISGDIQDADYGSIDYRAIEKEVLTHSKVLDFAKAARAKGGPEAEAKLMKDAALMAHTLRAATRRDILALMKRFAGVLFHRLYTGIIVEKNQFVELRELCSRARAEGRSLVLLPCHRSHIDYFVFQFLLYHLRLSLPPVIAAGDNLNIPLVGKVLRRSGAFFIRRSFGGPDGPLYTAVVSAYMECLVRRGINVLFFPEGGRSRSGKLLQPKVGMLGMVMDPILHGQAEDAYVVPLSIYYDRVLETNTYIDELLGAQKRKESLSGVISKASLFFNQKLYGNIHVRVARGFSLKSFVHHNISLQQAGARPNFDPKTSHEDSGVLLKALGYTVLDEINRVSGVSPAALVGTALLCSLSRAYSRQDLMRKVEWLKHQVIVCGGHVPNYYKLGGGVSEEVFDSALAVIADLVTRQQGLLEPVYAIAPGKHFLLSYYRNMCVHVFIHQAIVAAVLYKHCRHNHALRQVPRQTVAKDVAFLSRLLKSEFVFASATGEFLKGMSASYTDYLKTLLDKTSDRGSAPGAAASSRDRGAFSAQQRTALVNNVQVALEHLVQAGVVEFTDDFILVEGVRRTKRNDEVQVWNEHLIFLGCLVWPVIESYWVVLAGLVFMLKHGYTIISEAEMVTRIHAFSRTLLALGHVRYAEGAFMEPIKAALRTYIEMGHVQFTKPFPGAPFTLSLGPEYQSAGEAGGLEQLSAFLDEVASFRHMWLDQEGYEDYPEHIANLAFALTTSKL